MQRDVVLPYARPRSSVVFLDVDGLARIRVGARCHVDTLRGLGACRETFGCVQIGRCLVSHLAKRDVEIGED